MANDQSEVLLTKSDQLFLLLFFAPLIIGVSGLVLGSRYIWAEEFVLYGSFVQLLLAAIFALRSGPVSFSARPEILVIPFVGGTIPLGVLLVVDRHSVIAQSTLALIAIAASLPVSMVLGYMAKVLKRQLHVGLMALCLFPQSIVFCRWVNMRFDSGELQAYYTPALWTTGTTTTILYPTDPPTPVSLEVRGAVRDGEVLEMDLRPGALGIPWVSNARATGKPTDIDPRTFQQLQYEVAMYVRSRTPNARSLKMLALMVAGFLLPVFGVLAFGFKCQKCGKKNYRMGGPCRGCGNQLVPEAFED